MASPEIAFTIRSMIKSQWFNFGLGWLCSLLERLKSEIHFPNSLDSKMPKQTTKIEGSLEVKLPTIWTDEKQSREEAERRERSEERRVEEKE